jgi:hypothetical protein
MFPEDETGTSAKAYHWMDPYNLVPRDSREKLCREKLCRRLQLAASPGYEVGILRVKVGDVTSQSRNQSPQSSVEACWGSGKRFSLVSIYQTDIT